MSQVDLEQGPSEGRARRGVWLQALPALIVAAAMLAGAVWVYFKGRPPSETEGQGAASQPGADLESLRRGRSFIELKLHREAVPHLRSAYAARPSDPEVCHLLGMALAGSGSIGEACPLLERAALARPNAEAYHVGLAKAYRELGRYDAAVQTGLHALKNNPSNVETHNLLGFVYGRQRRYSEARLHYRTALALDPDNRTAKTNLELLQTLPKEPRKGE